MKKTFLIFFLFMCGNTFLYSQELYVFTEPASNMPAHSLTLKLTDHFVTRDEIYGRFTQRYMPEIMFGISKKLMIHASATFSNMHTPAYRYESAGIYAKYRFIANDAVHRHFRMAAFIDASKTKAPFHYEEITLMGDKSGIAGGIIATQLWNKFALSATISHTQLLDSSRTNKVIYIPERSYESMNYSLSAGYLLFPREYKNYRQLNVNLYGEFLASQDIDIGKYALDIAPAVQFIFNSNTKLNIGYKTQLSGDLTRMSRHSFQVSIERTLLNAL